MKIMIMIMNGAGICVFTINSAVKELNIVVVFAGGMHVARQW